MRSDTLGLRQRSGQTGGCVLATATKAAASPMDPQTPHWEESGRAQSPLVGRPSASWDVTAAKAAPWAGPPPTAWSGAPGSRLEKLLAHWREQAAEGASSPERAAQGGPEFALQRGKSHSTGRECSVFK